MNTVLGILGVLCAIALPLLIYGTIFRSAGKLYAVLGPEERAKRRRALLTRALPMGAVVALVCLGGGLVGTAVLDQRGFLQGAIIAAVSAICALFLAIVVIAIVKGVPRG